MTDDNGKHDHRELPTGETAYLTKDPGSNWRVDQYERSWFDGERLIGPGGGMIVPNELQTRSVSAQDLGWQDRRFDTEDEAYAFVAEQIRAGKAPRLEAS